MYPEQKSLTASWLSLVVLLAAVAAFLPRAARAVSTADEAYALALQKKPQPDHGAQIFALCSACHGQDGTGTTDGAVPAIAGQYTAVLLKQIIDFRYDARHSIRVQGFLSHHELSPQDLADVAGYVSRLAPRQPSAATPSSPRGAALFASLCTSCHGSRGEGNARARVPRLAGQHAEYLDEQLRDTTQGGRPGMMRDHAQLFGQLSAGDMDALSDYLSGLAPSP